MEDTMLVLLLAMIISRTHLYLKKDRHNLLDKVMARKYLSLSENLSGILKQLY